MFELDKDILFLKQKKEKIKKPYRARHSKFLRRYFDISEQGVDWYNDYNIPFEFKETWAKKEKDKIFKVPRHQLEESNYIVFFNEDYEFYVFRSSYLIKKCSFNNKEQLARIRINRIRNLEWLMEFNKIKDLKTFIKNLKK